MAERSVKTVGASEPFSSAGRLRPASGFTMVETMVASAVLMLFVTGFTIALITAIRTLDTTNSHHRAMSIARNRLQRASSIDFESLELLSENEVRIDQFGNGHANGRFRRSTIVTTNWPTPHTVWIQVGVRYPVSRGLGLSPPLTVDALLTSEQ